MAFQGGCACKKVRYEVSADPIAVMNCHCRACQYASGGGYTTAVVVPPGSFKIVKLLPSDGEEQQYRIKSAAEAFERVAKESQLDRDR